MIPLPNVSDVISSTTDVSTVVFPALCPAIWLVLGVIIAVLVVGFTISVFGKAGKAVLKRRRR